MELRRTYKYRLYPTKQQIEALEWTLGACRRLYNAAIQERRDAWKMNHVSINFYGQSAQLVAIKQDAPELRGIYGHVLADVLQRADKSFKAFYRRVKAHEKAGYPRFKGRDRYDSFTYSHPLAGYGLIDGRLHLAKIGELKIKLHRPIAGEVKTLTLKREGGHWYAMFSAIVEAKPLPISESAIGIDVGLESFLATSEGEFVDNPRLLRNAQDGLAKAQRRLSRRKRGSNRRRKAKALVAVHHAKVANARKDFQHKLALRLIRENGVIAAEDLKIRNMVRNHSLAFSISDAGWGQFISILQAKAEYAGREVVLVNPRNTSQACSGCGEIVQKELSERWHDCSCGVSLHRDVNAARNILSLGLRLRVGTRELRAESDEATVATRARAREVT